MNMNTQDLCVLLSLTKEGLKTVIQRNRLKDRLLEKGYELLSIEKKGRSNIYHVRELVTIQIPKETWDEYAAKEFPTVKKIKELGIHTKERLIKGTESTSEIADKAGVARQTASRWDGLLVEKGYMQDGGYAYYQIKNGELIEITLKEFSEHWAKRKQTKTRVRKLAEVAESASDSDTPGIVAENMTTAMQGSYCIRVKSYLVKEFTEQYQKIAAALNNN